MSLAEEYCDKCEKFHPITRTFDKQGNLITVCPNAKEYNPIDSTVDKALLVTPTTFADVYKKLDDIFNSDSMYKLKKHYFSRVETLNYNYHNLFKNNTYRVIELLRNNGYSYNTLEDNLKSFKFSSHDIPIYRNWKDDDIKILILENKSKIYLIDYESQLGTCGDSLYYITNYYESKETFPINLECLCEVKDKEYSLQFGLSHFDIINILEKLEKFLTNYDIWESRIKKRTVRLH